jgi:hypothetical protein
LSPPLRADARSNTFSSSRTVSNVNSYQDNSHEFVFDLSFTKSLGFKTGRKKEFGSVQGYVVSENGEPGEGVLLRLGAFNFGDLPSGRWVLHVPELEDQGSFRLDNFVLNHEKTNLTDNSLLFFPDEQKGKGLATLNINEGDSIQIELSHLPPIPRVKMIESGSLISVGR